MQSRYSNEQEAVVKGLKGKTKDRVLWFNEALSKCDAERLLS
jgi:hypothetical protein